jgi:alpha-D-ribose 1-methylphosphonate 5-triphosphate synthase subunit PhnH
MVRETKYDEVFDAQKHFRSMLDCMARPGKTNRLDPVEITPPGRLNRASVLVAFALLDANTAFQVVNMEQGESAYLAANTNAVRASTEDATFLFADGDEAPEILDGANCGALTYPDTAATLILQVKSVNQTPRDGSLKLTLQGPGVDGSATLFVRGLNPDLLLALEARNAEFPLGVDAFLTFADENELPCVTALPRTTKVNWEYC